MVRRSFFHLLTSSVIAASTLTLGCSGDETNSATTSSTTTGDPPVQGVCPVCSPPSNQGTLKNAELAETSGIAASPTLTDVFYAHNDSGDSSRLFAFSRAGDDLGTLNLVGAKNDDWEDMSTGPCLSGTCIYIGDIGDNLLDRTEYAIYRAPEPDAIQPGAQSIASEKIVFTYEDGPQDAEVLLVHPTTGVVTIITKVATGPASIYELPASLSPSKTYKAMKVGEIQPPKGDNKLTGGAVRPDGTGLLLRSHSNLFYYPMKADQTAAEALAFGACSMLVAEEKQGEAVTWLPSGLEIMTVGEGAGALVIVSTCDPD